MHTQTVHKKRCIFFMLIFVTSAFSFSQEIGLVLAGGGGKGAYQVGVWKALSEYGLSQKVSVISGTSVGGLNGALFACANQEEIERIWKDIVPSELTRDALISQTGLSTILSQVPLTKLTESSFPTVIVTAVRKRLLILKTILGGDYTHRFCLNQENDVEEIKNELLATSAFPIICNPVRLKDGYDYIDGGGEEYGGDNVPIAPIIQSYPHIRTIIIVYLQDAQNMTRRIRQIDYEGYELVEIIPSIDMGDLFEGTTNFTSSRINLLISQGYEDACAVLTKKGFGRIASYWFTE